MSVRWRFDGSSGTLVGERLDHLTAENLGIASARWLFLVNFAAIGAVLSILLAPQSPPTMVRVRPGDEMKRKQYAEELKRLQAKLCMLQQWIQYKGLRIIIVFEGRDAAGKGGTIKAITERVSPRVFRVVALPAPSDREKSQLYIQRYVPYFPAAGELVIFDRSWYNRAGVEHVMGFCTEEQHSRFLQLAPTFEKVLTDNGIILLKYWLEVGKEEQARRFEARIDDPLRQWKLSPMDIDSWNRWDDYTKARDQMLEATDTPRAPWHIIRSDNKKSARLNCISHLLSAVPFQEVPRDKVKLPKRPKHDKYDSEQGLRGRTFVPERY